MYKWKIWYSNTSITGNTREEWENAPYDDVQAVYEILGYKENGTRLGCIHSGVDWYWMNPDNDHISNNGEYHPEVGKWLESPAPINSLLKRGVQISDELLGKVDEELAREISNG